MPGAHCIIIIIVIIIIITIIIINIEANAPRLKPLAALL